MTRIIKTPQPKTGVRKEKQKTSTFQQSCWMVTNEISDDFHLSSFLVSLTVHGVFSQSER